MGNTRVNFFPRLAASFDCDAEPIANSAGNESIGSFTHFLKKHTHNSKNCPSQRNRKRNIYACSNLNQAPPQQEQVDHAQPVMRPQDIDHSPPPADSSRTQQQQQRAAAAEMLINHTQSTELIAPRLSSRKRLNLHFQSCPNKALINPCTQLLTF